jgi:hypothetical protein
MLTCPSLRRPVDSAVWVTSEAEASSFRLRAWRGRLDRGFFRGCIMGSTRNIVIVIAVVLSACAAEQRESLTPRAPTLKEQSLLLKIGMSEQEVTKLLGLPSKAEVGQCGENTPRPWTCKTWTYGSAPFYPLQAFFRENAGEWRLASWNLALEGPGKGGL